MLLFVFVRKRIGLKLITFNTWFIGSSVIGLYTIISLFASDVDNTGKVSVGLFFLHSILFNLFSIWRAFGAWRNMRRSGKSGVTSRHSYSIGESITYPIVRFFLNPLKLIDDEIKPSTFWKVNEDRWMEFWEPLCMIATGFLFYLSGYTGYGSFIVFASIALWHATFIAFNNRAKIKQAQVDAGKVSDVIEPETERSEAPTYTIR